MSEKIQVFSELFLREERVAHLTNADQISKKYAKQPFSWAPAFARSLSRQLHACHACVQLGVCAQYGPLPPRCFPVSTEGNVTEWEHVCLNVFILTILFTRSLLFTFSKPSFSEFCHFSWFSDGGNLIPWVLQPAPGRKEPCRCRYFSQTFQTVLREHRAFYVLLTNLRGCSVIHSGWPSLFKGGGGPPKATPAPLAKKSNNFKTEKAVTAKLAKLP